ncbi:extensin-like [Schistocerca piceifrons]|uniref:extensin-like n=1 Tax=Schistocerca piceifrons TaxID=274613 RepID=UPI001F5FC41D|nr:extensin-like [Schistocerca piceifrons]
MHLNGLGKQLVTLKLMEIIQRLQYLPTTSSVVPVSSSQKVSLGVTNAESDTVTENAAEGPKEAILTEVESTAASEEPRSVTAEATPPALERAPTAVTPSPSPAVTAQTTSPEIAEETPSATAEATPPAVELVPIAAAPSPTPAVVEPTPLPVIAETTPPPAATKPTSPTAEQYQLLLHHLQE